MSFDDLEAHIVRQNISDRHNVACPSATLAVIVLCLHAFTNYLEPGSWRVKLGELANIHDLSNLPEFDPKVLMQLAEKHHLADAIDFVSREIQTWIGPPRFGDPEHFNFPLRLTYCEGWAKPFGEFELALPLRDRKLNDRLPATKVEATSTDSPDLIYYGNYKAYGEFEPIRGFTHSCMAEQPDITAIFSVKWDEHGAIFSVYPRHELNLDEEMWFSVHTSERNGGWHRSDDRGTCRAPATAGACNLPLIARAWKPQEDEGGLSCLLYVTLEAEDHRMRQTLIFPLDVEFRESC